MGNKVMRSLGDMIEGLKEDEVAGRKMTTRGIPIQKPPNITPQPQIRPFGMKSMPRTAVPSFDPDYNEKWGVGLPHTQAPEPEKWQKNWQSEEKT